MLFGRALHEERRVLILNSSARGPAERREWPAAAVRLRRSTSRARVSHEKSCARSTQETTFEISTRSSVLHVSASSQVCSTSHPVARFTRLKLQVGTFIVGKRSVAIDGGCGPTEHLLANIGTSLLPVPLVRPRLSSIFICRRP